MIMVPVDEAAAFDMLAILRIKMTTGGLEVHFQYDQLYFAIQAQLEENKPREILASDEYKALLEANRKVWEVVEWAARDLCKASVVDQANQARHHAKQALQRKFFSSDLTEQKSVRPYEQTIDASNAT